MKNIRTKIACAFLLAWVLCVLPAQAGWSITGWHVIAIPGFPLPFLVVPTFD